MPLAEDLPANDPANARLLAAAAQFAYYPAERGVAAFRDELGLTAKLVSVDNTQAYVAHDANSVLVAFRGSEGPTSIDGLKDWLLTNALNLLIVPEGPLSTEFAAAGVGAKFHQGFVGAISEIWDPLFAAVDAEMKQAERPLWVTGHSLGGALALLGAWLLKRKFVPVHRVVTFGAPMVGNAAVAEAFGREFPGSIARFVNAPDPVPLLPMMSLLANDYAHCDTVVPLADGAAADILGFVQDLAKQAGGAVLAGNISDDLWNAVKSRVSAHLLDDYRKLLG